MKKLFLAAVCMMAISFVYAGDPSNVDEKVLKAFKENFSDVKNPQWYEHDNNFTVRFVRNNIDTRITYNSDANIIRTMRYYEAKYLPAFILGKVTDKYAGKSVFGVTESTTDAGVEYYITLQDDKNWMVVVSDANGSMRVNKKFKKA
ncbi:MAG: hypothetical protein GC171_03325 [Terrimonas sp.]|nr:hypothetical protein [Terrimonas sp.]